MANSNHGSPISHNLLQEVVVDAPNQAWIADLTSIRLPNRLVSLATMLDAFSRLCVGWNVSRALDAQLILDAFNAALAQRRIGAGLIHRSDRERQYASRDYTQRLQEVGARISM